MMDDKSKTTGKKKGKGLFGLFSSFKKSPSRDETKRRNTIGLFNKKEKSDDKLASSGNENGDKRSRSKDEMVVDGNRAEKEEKLKEEKLKEEKLKEEKLKEEKLKEEKEKEEHNEEREKEKEKEEPREKDKPESPKEGELKHSKEEDGNGEKLKGKTDEQPPIAPRIQENGEQKAPKEENAIPTPAPQQPAPPAPPSPVTKKTGFDFEDNFQEIGERGQCDQYGCACERYVMEPNTTLCKTCGHDAINHVPENEDFDDLAWLDDRLQKAAAPAVDDSAEGIIQKFKEAKSPELIQPWQLDPTELIFDGVLGEGVTARVFQGEYRGQEVAIKVFKGKLDDKSLASFTKEFEIMSNVRSPHVVFFYGACLQPMLAMVMEMCHKGSLCAVLQNPNEDITWERALKVAEAAIRGIYCLHSWKPPIVHRDLKSLNLLIDSNWNVKVGDFGLSRFTAGAESTLVKIRGTYAYCAPEVYFGQPFSPKADVYSLGIILWELVSRCIKGEYLQPYLEYSHLVYDFQIIIQTARNGLRPTIPPTCPPTFANLISSCWDGDAEKRPLCGEILEAMRVLQKEYKANKQVWDAAIQKK